MCRLLIHLVSFIILSTFVLEIFLFVKPLFIHLSLVDFLIIL